ncbi:hypothetical protein AB6A40_008735 [Gnathostoma spinigerum]|uniref:Connector enhancer of kinase suppressor of ras 2 n=1 Tax=Gnathostoma spinigerum TaxID=75299 RepID=A0ABD6EQA8_9BILA
MGVHEVIRPRNEAISLYTPPAPTSFASVVEAWTTEQLIQWMQGIDDAILPYLDCFAKNKVDGRSVFLLDDADLMNIGIDCFGVRAIITQAIQLLHHFCYELATENVQSLCLNVMVSARELVNEVQTAEWRSARAPSRAHLTAIHSAVYLAVSNVNEALKKLFHWLERRPLERHTSYKNMKDDLRLMQIDLLHSTKAQSKKMRLSFSLLIKNANRIIEKCDDILKNGSDHLLIQVSYLERAVLRKSKASSEWGIILQSSYQGVHEINELRSHSPADACEKIDVGDEIIQINGETVVGWDLGKVAQKISTCDQMKETSIYELVLLLKKMPADSDGSYSFHRFHSGQPYQLRSKRRRTGLLELSPSVRELFSPFYSKTPSCSIKQKRRSSSLPFLKQNSHLTVSNSQASISYLSENPSVISQFNSQVSSRRASVPCTSLNRDELSLSSGMLLNVELPLKQSPNREENTNLEPRKGELDDRDQIDSNISFEPDEYAVIDLLDEAELCSVDSSSLERQRCLTFACSSACRLTGRLETQRNKVVLRGGLNELLEV